MDQPKVTFAFINCNRLRYLKSAVESFHQSVKGQYDNIETIIIDNHSVEPGTDEYLAEKEAQGCKVWKQEKRDPSHEFAHALNKCYELATGEYVGITTGDVQFVLHGKWLSELVEQYSQNVDTIGCIVLDAQRRVTHKSHRLSQRGSLFLDPDRYRISPWMGFYHRKWFDLLPPWNREIKAEGLSNLELEKVDQLNAKLVEMEANCVSAVPLIPPTVAIYSSSGPAAKVRMNRRYGDYNKVMNGTDWMYYSMHNYEFVKMMTSKRSSPMSIEEIAQPVGWSAPLLPNGDWNKGHLDVDNLDTFESKDVSETP